MDLPSMCRSSESFLPAWPNATTYGALSSFPAVEDFGYALATRSCCLIRGEFSAGLVSGPKFPWYNAILVGSASESSLLTAPFLPLLDGSTLYYGRVPRASSGPRSILGL
jgi:hypothetical protein